MSPNLLILGGTTEARALCQAVVDARLHGVLSYAGRTRNPVDLGLPQRVGGFGGAAGLADYIRAQGITHVIDATHPFAAQMSKNAVIACAEVDVPLMALTRAPWTAEAGDRWQHVPDIDGAVRALDQAPTRVMLAVGRMHLEAFAVNPAHFYLLRLVDSPEGPLPFPNHHALIARGPFNVDDDIALMRRHDIRAIVSKNAGGNGAKSKILAARALGLPVIMIDRPDLPQRAQVHHVQGVMDWLAH
ncbi:MAG: cobalt-precorrin-6A reductase [Pelagimonas sp.]|jgi:precorrin-6A/cobalt-precorrin-6A reductase|nr:cobalt-precorrin-6A reductase [Pelagimonas sp.]